MLNVLPRWKLFAGVWLATVSALGTGLLAVRLGYSPLDDPDQAHQRPGYVDSQPAPLARTGAARPWPGGHQIRGVLHPP